MQEEKQPNNNSPSEWNGENSKTKRMTHSLKLFSPIRTAPDGTTKHSTQKSVLIGYKWLKLGNKLMSKVSLVKGKSNQLFALAFIRVYRDFIEFLLTKLGERLPAFIHVKLLKSHI